VTRPLQLIDPPSGIAALAVNAHVNGPGQPLDRFPVSTPPVKRARNDDALIIMQRFLNFHSLQFTNTLVCF